MGGKMGGDASSKLIEGWGGFYPLPILIRYI